MADLSIFDDFDAFSFRRAREEWRRKIAPLVDAPGYRGLVEGVLAVTWSVTAVTLLAGNLERALTGEPR